MSQSVITTAFEQLKAEQAANGGILTLDEFVFANVPDLNITDPIDRGESWPAPEQIVHRQVVSKTGTVNGNAVVYSVVLGAETGDFDFNWIGLINKASNTVAMIVHAPVQKKIKTASGQQGNVLTRSFMMEYNGASQITQITTPADTWQIDFTARLAGMDERIRKENVDTYGVASFYHDGFLVSQEDGGYSVKKGVGYVAGLRAELLLDKEIAAADLPVKVWVDVCWKGLLTSVWNVETKIVVADVLNDYSDNDKQHYVYAIAEIQAGGVVVDLRGSTVKPSPEIIADFSADLKKKQPLSDNLTLLSNLDASENKLPYFKNSDVMGQTDLSETGRDIISKSSIADVLNYFGLEDAVDAIIKKNNLDDLPDKAMSRANLNTPKGSDKQMCNEWLVMSGVNTVTIGDSIGISSVVRTGVGQYTVNLLKPYATTDYAVVGRWSHPNIERGHELCVRPNRTTSSFQLYCAGDSDNLYPPSDATELSLSIFGTK